MEGIGSHLGADAAGDERMGMHATTSRGAFGTPNGM
ncbi:hypothetical protein J2X68_004561 [Streptomyces sp. 3330]|nr:hypothetical protein [Streptomyces sp. 3330]